VAIALVAVLAGCLAGCTGGSFADKMGLPPAPTRAEIAAYAAMLPPQEAKELPIYFDEHPNPYNLDVHSKDSCPFINYIPAYYEHEAGLMSDQKYAEFLRKFFRAKHKKEGHCRCAELLAGEK